eukprot:gnl/TRDRNA2_/TRDRNA2_182738_c0_seq1.p1 gnl/TRDRNA2_/TRDRNA2_182738_c0~~gnl/TRDRNA2_/TRDRNA2_182738_c0_seq1.p1  ORF type:complete len:139 (-),score=16.30 gnl/TRDRNA2_/TRDRNA2_182738_c0_seq1:120-536(-)
MSSILARLLLPLLVMQNDAVQITKDFGPPGGGPSFLATNRSSCSYDLSSERSTQDFDYVCDTTVAWLHFKTGSSWAAATPPSGTGCHKYVWMQGGVPKEQDGTTECTVGEACAGCTSPQGTERHEKRLSHGSSNCQTC